MVKIKFPTRIKFSKENPIEDFYKKCMNLAFNKTEIKDVDVTSFCVHPKDYSKLKKLLAKHVKKNFIVTHKRLLFETGMFLLNYGPRTSKLVEEGTVEIDEDNLYG